MKTETFENLTYGIADNLPTIKNNLILSIEDMIFKITGDELDYTDRLKLAHKIVAQCINLPMTISDHYSDMLNIAKSIITSVTSSNGNS